MRILYWPEFHLPYIGGAEILSAHFLPEVKRRGHELFVLTSHGDKELPDREDVDGIPVVRMHFRKALEQKNLRALAEWLCLDDLKVGRKGSLSRALGGSVRKV